MSGWASKKLRNLGINHLLPNVGVTARLSVQPFNGLLLASSVAASNWLSKGLTEVK